MRPTVSLAAATLVLTSGMTAGAQMSTGPTNLGFESRLPNGRPTGWFVNGQGFELVVDSTQHFAGGASLRTRWIDSVQWTEESRRFAVASQTVPMSMVAGRRLHLTGYIRTEGLTTGFAGFWMRVDGPSGTLAFDNMNDRGPRGTTPWTKYDIELPVDSGAINMIFGVLHPGNGTAWYDSLTLDVVGPAMARTIASVPPFRPEPRPAEDMTRLLTDAELALPHDSIAVSENPTVAAWVRGNAHAVRSLGASDFSDLRFLGPVLAGKRIVQLGESGHGVAEFDMAKVRLIRFLHESLGYDVIAFESSTFECDRAQRNVATLSAFDLMRACIFGVWHASETLPLFEYIKQTQSTPHPLILAGFDEQTSSASASARPAFFRSLIAPIDSAYARRVYETDSVFLAKDRAAPAGTIASEYRARYTAFYDTLATFLGAHRKDIDAAHRDDPHAAMIARQAALSMKVFVNQLSAGPSGEGTAIRDRGMADNLDFLLDSIYPGKKFINWAHNFHIQARGGTDFRDTTKRGQRTMGTWVVERHRPELYTVGLFMYRGSAAMNNRAPYPIAQMRRGSLESILHSAPWRYSFVDFSRAPRAPGSEWMWSTIMSMSWGTQTEFIVPRDEYDGVLFIDTTHPPQYLNAPPPARP
jgi:erythromycin esterase